MDVTPSGTHCWICGSGPKAAGYPICPCAVCQENYKRTGEYQPKEAWKPGDGK